MADARLELVERFEDLRVSDVVVVRPCEVCQRSHRVMLTSFIENAPITRPFLSTADIFLVAPTPECASGTHGYGVAKGAVEAKVVFREVIPPAEVTEERAAARSKELENAGSRRGTR